MKENAIYQQVKELDLPEGSDDRPIKDEIVSVSTKDSEGIWLN